MSHDGCHTISLRRFHGDAVHTVAGGSRRTLATTVVPQRPAVANFGMVLNFWANLCFSTFSGIFSVFRVFEQFLKFLEFRSIRRYFGAFVSLESFW